MSLNKLIIIALGKSFHNFFDKLPKERLRKIKLPQI